MGSVKTNFLWMALFQLLKIITPLLTVPYLARVLGSEELGKFSYGYTVAYYCMLICMLGLNQYGAREIAKFQDDSKAQSSVFWSIYPIQIAAWIIVAIGYCLYCVGVEGELRLVLLVFGLWVIGDLFDISWYCFGIEQFRSITIRNVVIRILTVAGIFIFVRGPEDLWIYCMLPSLGSLLGAIVLWPTLLKRVQFTPPTFASVKQHIKPTLMLAAPVIAISFYTQLDKIMLGLMANMSELGFYDNAEKVVFMPLAVIQAMGTVMLPRMTALGSQGKEESIRRAINGSVRFSTVLSVAMASGVIAITPEFVPTYFGNGFERIGLLLPILAFVIPIISWSNVFGVQYLLPKEQDRLYLLSVIVGAIVNLGLNLVMIPMYGAVGASIATLFAELLVLLVQAIAVRKNLPILKYLRELVPFLGLGLLTFIAVRCVAKMPINSVLLLISEVLAGVVVYLVGLLVVLSIMRDPFIQKMQKKASSVFRSRC